MRRGRRGSELPFPVAVLGMRVRRMQARLRADGLAGLFCSIPRTSTTSPGSRASVTSYQTLLPSAGRPTLISRKVNQYLARATPSLGAFVPIEDTADAVAVTLEALRRTRGRLGLETSAWYPHRGDIPGVAAGAVDRACRAVLERAGLGRRFAHRTGYAVGIGFPPNWSEGGRTLALRPGEPTLLRPA